MIVVYEATNRTNGKRYVGITRRTAEARFARHVYDATRSSKTHFHKAIAKYGSENFSVATIATCLSHADAWKVERDVIRDRRPEYNMTNGGEFTVGKRVSREIVERIRAGNTGKKRTATQNARMSQIKREQYAQRPDLVQKTSQALVIARATPGAREKQRAAASRVSKNRIWRIESRLKLAAASRIRESINRKMVECATLATVFDSLNEAAELLELSRGNISRVCRTGRGHTGGLEFRFVSAV